MGTSVCVGWSSVVAGTSVRLSVKSRRTDASSSGQVIGRITWRHVGQQNVELAEQMLADEGIPVVERDLGGSRGRRLRFRTDDGAAHVTLI